MRFSDRCLSARTIFPATIIALALAHSAWASFVNPVSPSWAGGPNSTMQSWNIMTGTAGGTVPTAGTPLNAQTSVNANGFASWYDAAAPGDGSFNAGGDVYSFSGVLNPVATIPSFNIAGNRLKVFTEIQYFGGIISDALTATYQDHEGNSHAILASTLPDYQFNTVYTDGGNSFGGFGLAYKNDVTWEFTLPQDTASLQLSWGWGVTSSALQGMSVYTQSVVVPEPSTMFLAGIGFVLLIVTRYRRRRMKCARRMIHRLCPVAADA
jgi:hypothetical protein